MSKFLATVMEMLAKDGDYELRISRTMDENMRISVHRFDGDQVKSCAQVLEPELFLAANISPDTIMSLNLQKILAGVDSETGND